MGNVLRHRFEFLQLFEVPDLLMFFIRDSLELAKNHVPSVVCEASMSGGDSYRTTPAL